MNRSTDAELAVPVIEERLEVHRHTVDTGPPVRLRKQVEEVAAAVREPLTVETVDVERVPIGHVVDELPQVRQEGDVTVVPVVAERLVTRTEFVLVEEIRLRRRREVIHAETEVPLRREHVSVERFDRESGQWIPEPGGQGSNHPHTDE